MSTSKKLGSFAERIHALTDIVDQPAWKKMTLSQRRYRDHQLTMLWANATDADLESYARELLGPGLEHYEAFDQAVGDLVRHYSRVRTRSQRRLKDASAVENPAE